MPKLYPPGGLNSIGHGLSAGGVADFRDSTDQRLIKTLEPTVSNAKTS